MSSTIETHVTIEIRCTACENKVVVYDGWIGEGERYPEARLPEGWTLMRRIATCDLQGNLIKDGDSQLLCPNHVVSIGVFEAVK